MHLLKDRGFIHPTASEITPRDVYLRRRDWLRQAAAGGATLALGDAALAQQGKAAKLPGTKSAVPGAIVMDTPTAYNDATTYNNFYEFGTDKSDPARNAHTLKTQPWSITLEGEVKKPKTFGLDELLKLSAMEERIYRMRCVEGWSMVIPWVGYSLSELLKQVEPTGNSKFVEFVTLADPKTMPYVGSRVLEWPYVEGLRLDEAMQPLTLLTFGMYGEVLPNQNGAPVRLVVPWKYGFKSAKSIVKIRLVDKQPRTASTPTSIRRSTTRAGARPPNAASARPAASSRRSGRR
jgi:sulfoxide reductase catalytic subunit YedY